MTAIRIRLLTRLFIGASFLVGIAGVYWGLSHSGVLAVLQSPDQVRQWIGELGVIGPIAVIAAMSFAIVVSPLPSAPIALAAGALYGHGWGTLYVIIGAESGALIAFAIARFLGRDVINRWLGSCSSLRAFHSQNALTLAVFASRMLPFLSFDIISYAAGLSPLRTWRFALATVLGITPASFALAHFGGELGSGDLDRALATVFALGGLTLVSIMAGWWWQRRLSRR